MSAARRFGGPRSPGAAAPAVGRATRWSGRAATSTSLRALMLFVWPTPLLLTALLALVRGDAAAAVTVGAAWALLIASASITRDGVRAAQAWEASALARAPALPRKLIGAGLTGAGVFLAGWLGAAGVGQPAIFGALAAALHVTAFGPDPLRAKGLAGLKGAALDEAVTRIETARRLIGEMTQAAASIGDRAITERVARLADGAQAVLAELERDPGDIRRARRFLAVYLVGARDATVKFAQAWADERNPDLTERFGALLDDLETHFARHRDEIAGADRAALDVEIDVLRDRLRLEGV